MNREPKKRVTAVDAHVGRRLRARRTLLGLSMEALAGQIDLSFQQLQKWEHGVNRISAGRLWLLAQLLGVPVGWFFEGLDGGAPETAAELPARRETLEMCRDIAVLPDPVRKQLRLLVKAVADRHPGRVAAAAE